MAAPTVLKPLAEMAIDENFFGGHIYPDDRGYSVKKADANRGTKYTWELSKNFTSWLNEATGGSEFRSGFIDFAPQSIDHMIKFMGGGVLQFAARWQNLAAKAIDGKEIERGDVPFSRRFMKQVSPKAAIGSFYDDKDVLNSYVADFKSLHGADKTEYRNKYKAHLELANFSNGIEKALRSLNARKRTIESSKLPEKEKEVRVQRIEDRKVDLSLRFSKKKVDLGIRYL